MQIKGKVEDIEALSSKLDHIEEMIGLQQEENKKEITKETLKSITQKNENVYVNNHTKWYTFSEY